MTHTTPPTHHVLCPQQISDHKVQKWPSCGFGVYKGSCRIIICGFQASSFYVSFCSRLGLKKVFSSTVEKQKFKEVWGIKRFLFGDGANDSQHAQPIGNEILFVLIFVVARRFLISLIGGELKFNALHALNFNRIILPIVGWKE